MKLNLKVLLQNAVYTAIYVTLCIVFAPISYGPIQVRIAEALCIIPLFDEFAIISVTLGCFLSNLYYGSPIDTIFGTLATFIGLIFIKLIKIDKPYVSVTKNFKIEVFFIKMLPSILSNAIIIPFVLKFAYSETMPLLLSGFYVGFGEVIAIYVLGYLLYRAIKRFNLKFESRNVL